MATIESITSYQGGQQSASSESVMGKEDFLTLLVAQLQNQDPLNPTDPTEFTAQLAQFSSLEQLIDINTNLEMQTAQAGTGLVSSVDALGKEVVAIADSVEFSGEPMDLGYFLAEETTSVTLTVRNEEGEVVRTLQGEDVDAGKHFLNWDGKDEDGNTVSQGQYSIHVEEQNGGVVKTGVPLVRAIITGLENGMSGAVFVTDVGEVNWGSVISIQEAGQEPEDA